MVCHHHARTQGRQDKGTLVQATPRLLFHRPLAGLGFLISNSSAPLWPPHENWWLRWSTYCVSPLSPEHPKTLGCHSPYFQMRKRK